MNFSPQFSPEPERAPANLAPIDTQTSDNSAENPAEESDVVDTYSRDSESHSEFETSSAALESPPGAASFGSGERASFQSAIAPLVDEEEDVDEEADGESDDAPLDDGFHSPNGARVASPTLEYLEFDAVFAQWKENGDPKLRERLILMHRHMVTFLARRFMERGDLFEDVVQVGMYGLINAVDSFDPSRGLKFSTFAMPSISGEIRRYFRDKVAGVRVPRHLQELSIRLVPRVEELTQQLKRAPTYGEIAESLGVEVEEVIEAMELGSALDPASLDDLAYNEPGGETLADTLGGLDPQLEAYQEHAALQTALAKLDAKDRRVLELAYFEGFSQSDIARQLSVSQMHISRVLRRALAQLRGLLEEP